MQALPIDAYVPRLLELMAAGSTCLLTAEPGAGKTTRVPSALAGAPWAEGRSIWVLQPRRLAALVAAWRVAEEGGHGQPGGFVGYHFRFERRESNATRVLFLTEGMFLRRLQIDPGLESVACVVLDEFHERSLDVDLALALLRLLQSRRPDLKLLLMSATIDARAISASLGDCAVLDCPGRVHPVDVSYFYGDRSDPAEPLERRAARGLRLAMGWGGDALVFLPGVAEIRRTAGLLAGDPFFDAFRVLALHGQLSPQEQRQALGPADKPKIVLATNVAETSLTVPGVRIVVDSTVARRDAFNPYSGLSALVTLPASRAAMTQRSGRAGRTAPGRCLRLCSSAEFQARPSYDVPELERADLVAALLQAAAAGFGDVGALPWLQAPPQAHIEASRALLQELGALDQASALTAKGRALARAPLHPRLAALAWEARAGTTQEWDALMACLALLEAGRLREPDFFTAIARFEARDSDGRLLQQIGDWLDKEKGRPAATQGEWNLRLTLALLRSFPDQVAFSRQGTDKRGETRFTLSTGVEASSRWDSFSVDPGFYLLVEVVESRALGQAANLPRAQSLVPLKPDWILEALPQRVREAVSAVFEPGASRVQVRERLTYGTLVLDEGSAHSAAAREAGARLLLDEARKAGLGAFCGEGQPERYLARRAYALECRPGAVLPDEEALWSVAEEITRQGALSFDALRQADPLRTALERTPQARSLLEELAPTRLRLSKGRETTIHYAAGQPPWVAARMQDFFGMKQTPRVAGRPLTVHLLAPNQRPQQVTQDLEGFWLREYPRLRKELMRRYPRHAWPEDPLA